MVTVLTSLAVGIVGIFLGRFVERARREEESLAALRKVRADALLEMLRALGQQHLATVRALIDELHLEREHTDDNEQRVLESARVRAEASRATLEAAFSRMFLIPPELRAPLSSAMRDLDGANSPEDAQKAMDQLGPTLELFLPPLPRYQLRGAAAWRARLMQK